MEPVPVLVVNEPQLLWATDRDLSASARSLGFHLATEWYSKHIDSWRLSPLKSTSNQYLKSSEMPVFEGTRIEIRAFLQGFAARHMLALKVESKLEQIKAVVK